MYSMVTENRKQTPSFSCTETIVFNPAYADSKFKTKIASEEVDFVLATPYQLIKAIEPIHTFSFSFNKQSLTAEVDSFHKKLSVYYHDPDFMIIFKPEDFLIDGDAWSVQEFLQRAYPQYPLFHLVHQLDFATSGIMTLALNKQAAGHACELFRRRVVRKEYIALVHGWVSKDYMEIRSPIKEDPFYPIRMCIHAHEGKYATTILRVLQRGYLEDMQATKVALELHTGRRHQLRVHLASIGHPILGDPTYASAPPLGSFHPMVVTHPFPRMYLHSRYMLLPLSQNMDHKDIAVLIEPNFETHWKCQCGLSQCHCETINDSQCSDKWELEAFQQYQMLEHTRESNKGKRSLMKRKKKKKTKTEPEKTIPMEDA